MSTDARAALSRFVAALERHFEAASQRRSELDPAVVSAYDDLAAAFVDYDDALFEAFDEVTPFDLSEDEDDEEEDDDLDEDEDEDLDDEDESFDDDLDDEDDLDSFADDPDAPDDDRAPVRGNTDGSAGDPHRGRDDSVHPARTASGSTP